MSESSMGHESMKSMTEMSGSMGSEGMGGEKMMMDDKNMGGEETMAAGCCGGEVSLLCSTLLHPHEPISCELTLIPPVFLRNELRSASRHERSSSPSCLLDGCGIVRSASSGLQCATIAMGVESPWRPQQLCTGEFIVHSTHPLHPRIMS